LQLSKSLRVTPSIEEHHRGRTCNAVLVLVGDGLSVRIHRDPAEIIFFVTGRGNLKVAFVYLYVTPCRRPIPNRKGTIGAPTPHWSFLLGIGRMIGGGCFPNPFPRLGVGIGGPFSRTDTT